MKDVVAVLGEGHIGSPLHVELVAPGIEDAGPQRTTDAGLQAIAMALGNCPPLHAECGGLVSVEVGSEDDSLTLAVKIGTVIVNVIIRAEAQRIGDNAEVELNEHLD